MKCGLRYINHVISIVFISLLSFSLNLEGVRITPELEKVVGSRNYKLESLPIGEFHFALAQGNQTVVEQLLKQYPALSTILNERQQSPLTVASYFNKPEIVRVLLQQGAQPSQQVASNLLRWALEYNYRDIIKILVQNKLIDINSTFISSRGNQELPKNALMFAIRNLDRGLAQWLIEELGADVNYGAPSPLFWALSSNSIPLVQLLIEKKANVTAITLNIPLLIIAIKNKNSALVQLLLESGADPLYGVDNTSKLTPLEYAIKEKQLPIVNLLLAKVKNIREVEKKRGIPLVEIAASDNSLEAYEIAKLLIHRGSDFTQRDIHSELTPLIAAIKSGNLKLAKLLWFLKAPFTLEDIKLATEDLPADSPMIAFLNNPAPAITPEELAEFKKINIDRIQYNAAPRVPFSSGRKRVTTDVVIQFGGSSSPQTTSSTQEVESRANSPISLPTQAPDTTENLE